MNKYQEALTNLEGIQMSDEYSLCDIDEIDTLDYDMNPKRFSPIEAFECLGELVNKEEKYRWHDLRKNPNDLPEDRDWVLAVFKELDTDFVLVPRVAEYIGRPTKVTTKDNWIILDSYNGDMDLNPYYENLVCIGWKDIEEFK